jgi:hypothetical protein
MIPASLPIKKVTTFFLEKLIVAQPVKNLKARYYIRNSLPLSSLLSQDEFTP